MLSDRFKDIKHFVETSFVVEAKEFESKSEEELVFLLHLEQFMKVEKKKLTSKPKLHEEYINLYKLAKVVNSLDGFEEVKLQKRWKNVAKRMGVVHIHVSTFKSLKHSYVRFIEPFLNHLISKKKLKCCQCFVTYDDYLKKFIDTFKNDIQVRNSGRDSPSSSQTRSSEPGYKVGKSKSVEKKNIRKSGSEASTSDNNSSLGSDNARSKNYRYSKDKPNEPFVDVKKGDNVYVRYSGVKRLYEATVLDIKNEDDSLEYYVHYYGWGEQYNEWIAAGMVVSKVDNSQSNATSQVKQKRGRKPKSMKPVVSPSPIVKDDNSFEKKKKTRHTYNSCPDDYLQVVLETSLKEYKHNSSGTGQNEEAEKSGVVKYESSESSETPSTENNDERPQINESRETIKEVKTEVFDTREEKFSLNLGEQRLKLRKFINQIIDLAKKSDYNQRDPVLNLAENTLEEAIKIIQEKINLLCNGGQKC